MARGALRQKSLGSNYMVPQLFHSCPKETFLLPTAVKQINEIIKMAKIDVIQVKSKWTFVFSQISVMETAIFVKF